MKLEMRRTLTREGFAEKIRKVEQLVRLTKSFPRRRAQAGKSERRIDAYDVDKLAANDANEVYADLKKPSGK